MDEWHTYFVTALDILVHNKANIHDKPAWIKHDVYNEIRNRFGKPGVNKFISAMKKGFVSAQNENGIKMLSGKGVEIGNVYYSYLRVKSFTKKNNPSIEICGIFKLLDLRKIKTA